jgi:hypothetical protein
MLIATLILLYQVFMVNSSDIAYLKKSHIANCQYREGFVQYPFDYGIGQKAAQELSDSLLGGRPGTAGLDLTGSAASIYGMYGQKSKFLGGGEPPVFYDIGDVNASNMATGYNSQDKSQEVDPFAKKEGAGVYNRLEGAGSYREVFSAIDEAERNVYR